MEMALTKEIQEIKLDIFPWLHSGRWDVRAECA